MVSYRWSIVTNPRCKVHLVGYIFVADGSMFIPLTIIASQICEITRNSDKIQGHRSWCQSKVQLQLPISH